MYLLTLWWWRVCSFAMEVGMASSHPVQVEVFSADEVSEIFDAISYYKGASVIRQVFDWIGPEAFQR